MTTKLLTGEGQIWPEISAAAKRASRADVAVAYFGQGGSKILPLGPTSRLVVDASEARVKTGGTCPAELLKLHNKGVAIYSVPNLHAKVFVFQRRAFIGSTNVSARSKDHLAEAVVETTDRDLISDARLFVRSLAGGNRVSPDILQELAKVWKPPKVPGHGAYDPSHKRRRAAVWIAGYDYGWYGKPTLEDEDASDAVEQSWSGNRQTHYIDCIAHGRKPSWRKDDQLVLVENGHPKRYVWPPAKVLDVRRQEGGGQRAWVTHAVHPYGNRCAFNLLAKSLGRGWKRRLQSDGRLSSIDAAKMLGWWDRRGVGS